MFRPSKVQPTDICLQAIKIRDGAVIGTRALVTREVEPYSIVGGNPAKMIRKRFDDRQIEFLLEMKWWDWPDERLKSAMPILTSGNVDALHQYWASLISGRMPVVHRPSGIQFRAYLSTSGDLIGVRCAVQAEMGAEAVFEFSLLGLWEDARRLVR